MGEDEIRADLAHIEKELGLEVYRPSMHWRVKYSLADRARDLSAALRNMVKRRPIGIPGSNSPNNEHLAKDGIMHIEFETEVAGKLTFAMVADGQLFATTHGLYQKSSDTLHEAWHICNPQGDPVGQTESFDHSEEIGRILPPIRRIAF
jgi:hypothetical protein